MHYKLDFVLVLLWPGLCDVDQSLEQHSTVSYHVEVQSPPEENIYSRTSLSGDWRVESGALQTVDVEVPD